ncbi:MAG: hypothetical protein JW822_01145 [Spirochaetales bacterium]|nr:hypothetical protein [Spirochaetales bacterium]
MNHSGIKSALPFAALSCAQHSVCTLRLTNTYLKYIYTYITKCKYFDQDDRHEFILYFYPILNKALHSFRYKGVPFEHYLSFLVSRRIKTFLKNKLKANDLSNITSTIFQSHEPPYSVTATPSPEINSRIKKILAISAMGKIENNAARKRFLFFIAKKAKDLTVDDIELASHLTDYKQNWLQDKLCELKQELQQKEERLKRYIERKNRLFLKTILLEKKILTEVDHKQKQILNKKLRKTNNHFKSILNRISKTSLSPSHREIAEVLNIPKGTIDTSLYKLKHLIKSG